MAEKKLTPKQKRFVDEYLIDLNATQAAIRAGYSEKTAYSIGIENLKKPVIQECISRRQTDRAKRAEISQERVLQELASIALADLNDFAKVERRFMVGLDGFEHEYKAVEVIPTDEIPREKRGAIAAIKQGAHGIEIKFNDKVRSLELLGRHLGMFAADDASTQDALSKLDGILEGITRKMADDNGN